MPPEVMHRAEMLSGLNQSLVDVLPGRTVSGEDHSEVLRVLCFFDHTARCVVDVVFGRRRFEQEAFVPVECEVVVSSSGRDHLKELLGSLIGKIIEVALMAEDPRHHASLRCEWMVHVIEKHTAHDEEEVQ